MPKKTQNGSSRAKTEFILGFPAGLSAKDVVAKAKARGFDATEGQVYSLRSYARKKGAEKAKVSAKVSPGTAQVTAKAAPVARRAKKPSAPPAAPAKAQSPDGTRARHTAVEKQLLGLVIELGLSQTEDIFDRVRTRVLTFAKT